MFSRARRNADSALCQNGAEVKQTVGRAIAAEIQCRKLRVSPSAPDQIETESSMTFIIAKPATASRTNRARASGSLPFSRTDRSSG